jgi:hypothetical protein
MNMSLEVYPYRLIIIAPSPRPLMKTCVLLGGDTTPPSYLVCESWESGPPPFFYIHVLLQDVLWGGGGFNSPKTKKKPQKELKTGDIKLPMSLFGPKMALAIARAI